MESSVSNHKATTKLQKFEFFVGIFNRMLVGFVTILVTFLCLQRLQHGDVPWHAILCTIGFNLIMTEGLLSFYKGNSTIYYCSRREKAILHISLQLLGSLLGIIGIIFRMNIDKVHFTTLHGKLGLAALVLCLMSLLCGLSALHSTKIKNYLQPLYNKTIHGILGILTYSTAIVCLISGYDTSVFRTILPFQTDLSVNIIIVLKLATVGILIATIYGPLGIAIKNLWN